MAMGRSKVEGADDIFSIRPPIFNQAVSDEFRAADPARALEQRTPRGLE